MEHDHEPAVVSAPAAPAGAGVQALRGSPRLLAAGNAAIARAIAARAAIGRDADAGAPPPPESAPGGAPVPAADPGAAQEALRLNGLSMPDLLRQLEGHGRQWVDLNREALVHTPGVGPQRMALAVEAVLAGPTAPDERLASMMGEMQAMGLPEDQQETVARYCGAFGLRAPSIMNRFIEGAKGLQQVWPTLDPESRARRIAELAIASLDRAGVPAPKGIDVQEIPEGGLWLKGRWRIVVAARIGSRQRRCGGARPRGGDDLPRGAARRAGLHDPALPGRPEEGPRGDQGQLRRTDGHRPAGSGRSDPGRRPARCKG